MAKEKVYEPEVIQDTPFPGQDVQYVSVSDSVAGGNYKPSTTKGSAFPTQKIAVELLSTALNTRSKKILQQFELAASGAIQIGNFEDGVTGDLRLTPNGLTARDNAGVTTFAIDGTTGDAVFAGTVQAGTLISGAVAVGNSDIVIDGDTKRMIFYNNDIPAIVIGLV